MPLQIDQDFPGGNIVVESVQNCNVYIRQRLDSEFPWFYWCCRVRGAVGQRIRFTMTGSRALGTRGPAFSCDDGVTWRWLGCECVDGNAFTVDFPADADCAYLSFAMPYLESHWRRFLDRLGPRPMLRPGVLCVTPQGREVELLELGCAKEPQHRIVITARHHCCEMMTNYALEGLIAWLLDAAEADWLRAHAQFLIVPFMDKDGVESGDQGKGRKPRDHNRDYDDESIYATTRAIRELLPAWGDGKLHVGLDLHCPYIAGQHNEVIYLVGNEQERFAQEQQRFSQMLEDVAAGPLPFAARDFLPFGQAWNTGQNFDQGRSFASWLTSLPDIILSSTIEFPYANVGEAEVNADTARRFGIDLGMAITRYLQQL